MSNVPFAPRPWGELWDDHLWLFEEIERMGFDFIGPVVCGITLPDMRCQSDAGAQFTSIRHVERLAEIGAVASIGTAQLDLDKPDAV